MDVDGEIGDERNVDGYDSFRFLTQQPQSPSPSLIESVTESGLETGATLLSPGGLRRSELCLERLRKVKLQASNPLKLVLQLAVLQLRMTEALVVSLGTWVLVHSAQHFYIHKPIQSPHTVMCWGCGKD